jgi:hypothetical protein
MSDQEPHIGERVVVPFDRRRSPLRNVENITRVIDGVIVSIFMMRDHKTKRYVVEDDDKNLYIAYELEIF